MTAIKATTSNNGRHNSACSSRTVASSKSRFTEAVTTCVAELMRQHGYSRDRATALLLRELKNGAGTPDDTEMFSVMKEHGIGLEDASKALIISRAMKRAKMDRGLSVVDAIDDLTSRMNLSTLLKKPDSSSVPDNVHVPKKWTPKKSESSRGAPSRKLTSTTIGTNTRKGSKGGKNGKQKPSVGKNNAGTKQMSRKRSMTKDDELEASVPTSRRTRSDSVSEVVIAKKAKLSNEEGSSPSRSMSPTLGRKRSHFGDETTTTSSPSKRARNDA